MSDLEKGITADGIGYAGKTWNISVRSISRRPFATRPSPSKPIAHRPVRSGTRASDPGGIHLVQEGVLDLKLDGVWVKAKAGDLVRLPRAFRMAISTNRPAGPCAVLGVARTPSRGFVRQSAQSYRSTEVVKISAQHEVDFLPPTPTTDRGPMATAIGFDQAEAVSL